MKKAKADKFQSLPDILADPDGWPGMVYFVQGDENTAIKIGYTNKSSDKGLAKRISSLQTGHPDPLNIIGTIDPAYMANEKALHKLLAPWRVRENGEWFKSDAVMSFIETNNHNKSKANETLNSTTLVSLFGKIEQEVLESEYGDFVRDFMCQQIKNIEFLISAPKLPLLGWLLLQEGRDDPVGDLASDARKDQSPFIEVSNLIGYKEKLPSYTWLALSRAYFECYYDLKLLGNCIVSDEILPWECRKNARVTL